MVWITNKDLKDENASVKENNLFLTSHANCLQVLSGTGGGTRTHTPLLTTDFESVSSANSDTPAYLQQ